MGDEKSGRNWTLLLAVSCFERRPSPLDRRRCSLCLRRDAQAPSAFSPALSVEGAQPLEQAGVMGEPRVYRGTFCTGHTPMVGSTAIQFSENTMHEFVEEYKSAHGLKHKVGPGNAKAYDPRAQAKRDAPPLPVAGCALARLGTGNKPERTQQTSSKAVGGWWNDPIFSQNAELPDVVVKVRAG